ncbi:MAG: sulfite oxidase [Pseudomonadota bacterium]
MASRRQLLRWSAALGAPIVFPVPSGIVPLALAQADVGKPGLKTLSGRPLNMETPAHLLDDEATPGHAMFVRNNGALPDSVDPADWRLEITGLVETPLSLSIADLKTQFEAVRYRLQMECGGNGRAFFSPGASGNQWTFGAIACPDWTGVRLRDVLRAAGVKDSAVYTGHYGADLHLSGDPDKPPISRGVPIAKAMEEHSLIAWAMNGADMPFVNGHPLRLVIPGWPGSCSQKWLTRIDVRGQVHDGPKMGGQSYRVPAYPVAPGAEVPDDDMVIIESMPVKSLITFPQTGVRRSAGAAFELRGHAWAGDRAVQAMDVSIDFGRSWQRADLAAPVNRYAWQRWRTQITLPQAGYYELWARAADNSGNTQPPVPPDWNPRGYLNNMQHRIAVVAL